MSCSKGEVDKKHFDVRLSVEKERERSGGGWKWLEIRYKIIIT